jgi:nucleoside-diphosphate-sugar epimerase
MIAPGFVNTAEDHMKILYIGGTGEISYSCVQASAAMGHRISVYNRGRCSEPLPAGTTQIQGDMADDAAYGRLGDRAWDVVCQFKAYKHAEIERDLRVFGGKVGQYVFISTASVYEKPLRSYVLTEAHPIGNKYWDYSQEKADMERDLLAAHAAGRMPVTIVRPSHTYRRNFPGIAQTGDDNAWRLLHGKPIVIHGDGTSLWTYTHADDFAAPFARLLGNEEAIGETFHLTAHRHGYTWNQIYTACAAALGVEPQLVHIPTDTLVRVRPDLQGNLLGDKAWPSLFDNSKVRAVVAEYGERVTLEEGLRSAAGFVRARLQNYRPDAAEQAFWDRLIAAQRAIAG